MSLPRSEEDAVASVPNDLACTLDPQAGCLGVSVFLTG